MLYLYYFEINEYKYLTVNTINYYDSAYNVEDSTFFTIKHKLFVIDKIALVI